MSYIQSSFSPYRGDLKKEVSEIISEDYEWVCSAMKSRGLMFGMAFMSIMGLSLVKAGVHAYNQMKKPKMTYDHLALARDILNSDNSMNILSRREGIDESPDIKDNLNPDTKTKTQKANAINELRAYLYGHDMTLRAKVLSTIDFDCTDSELNEMFRLGKFTKPLSSSYITFDSDLISLLKEVLKSAIDWKTDDNGTPCIEIFNNDCTFIETALQDIYNEQITIEFD